MSRWHEYSVVNSMRSFASASLLGVALLTAQAQAQPTYPHTDVSIATQLKEVQSGTISGRDYLTLHIGGHDVGPSTCRGNVLRMDTNGAAGADRQEEIEAIAISAMLTATTVMIVVPLDVDQCVDGKPTFKDLYALAPSPL